jgi:predicted transcriptional regulator of viral defense system
MIRTEYKNLTTEELSLLKLLDDNEIKAFTVEQIQKLAKNNLNYVRSAIERLAKRAPSPIIRIENGKYVRHDFRNEYVIGTFLVEDGVVAYWTALNLHGLTEQFPNTIFIQTTRQKKSKAIFGVLYQFIKVRPDKMAGIVTSGYGNLKFKITDVEKTIVDCFDLPAYSGGYTELIYALNKAKLNNTRLIAVAKAVNNIAAIKRLGFLLEVIDEVKYSPYIDYALSRVNKKYDLLDPHGDETGSYIGKWKLRVNLSADGILNIIQRTN